MKDTWQEAMKEADASLTEKLGTDRSPLRGFERGRRGPRADRFYGRQVNLYLREDVIQWLHEEAMRRGDGATPARIVTQLVRAEMSKEQDMSDPRVNPLCGCHTSQGCDGVCRVGHHDSCKGWS